MLLYKRKIDKYKKNKIMLIQYYIPHPLSSIKKTDCALLFVESEFFSLASHFHFSPLARMKQNFLYSLFREIQKWRNPRSRTVAMQMRTVPSKGSHESKMPWKGKNDIDNTGKGKANTCLKCPVSFISLCSPWVTKKGVMLFFLS